MTSAITPTATPMVEIIEMTEMKACFRFASRYRSAMWSSKGYSMSSFSLAHQGEQDDVANRWAVREQHHQSVDADALACCRWETVLQGPDVVLIHLVRLEIAACAILQLLGETPPLLDWIIER